MPVGANRGQSRRACLRAICGFRLSRRDQRRIYQQPARRGLSRIWGAPIGDSSESLFDELADALQIDRLDFRLQNALENGVATVCGQVFEQGVGIKACFQALTRLARGTRKSTSS